MLTPKQEAFCQAVASGQLSYSDAYRAAYDARRMKPTTVNRKAMELLGNGTITARIEELRRPAVEAVALSAEYVLRNLKEVVERSMQAAPVLTMRGEQATDEDGNNVWEFKGQTACKALELIGKYLGLWVEKKEEKVDMTLEVSWGKE